VKVYLYTKFELFTTSGLEVRSGEEGIFALTPKTGMSKYHAQGRVKEAWFRFLHPVRLKDCKIVNHSFSACYLPIKPILFKFLLSTVCMFLDCYSTNFGSLLLSLGTFRLEPLTISTHIIFKDRLNNKNNCTFKGKRIQGGVFHIMALSKVPRFCALKGRSVLYRHK